MNPIRILPRHKSISMFAVVSTLALLAARADAQAPAVKEPAARKKQEESKPAKPTASASATQPTPRSELGFWMDRHKLFLERVKPGKAGLLFIGDSITQGWEGQGKEVWRRYYSPRDAVNLGIGGDRTQHVLWRLDNGEIDGIQPRAAVVMIGTNNMISNTPDEIAEGVRLIVKRLRDKLPKTKILLLAIFPRSPSVEDPIRAKVKQTNERIAKLADGKDVRYLDIGPAFLESDGSIATATMPDFLHLTPKGYRLWADAIEPTLWEMTEGK